MIIQRFKMSDEMFISRTTVENTLTDIKTNLLTDKLEFVSDRNGN